jgi:hypothetical protein
MKVAEYLGLGYLEFYKTNKMKAANKKGLIATLVVVGLGAAAYFLFLRNKDGRGGRGGGAKMLPIANAIFDAMNGYGTGNDTIENQLKKLTTKSEWDALVRAFGTRTISSGTWNVFQDDFTGTLSDCLNDELDSSELESVNQILSKIGVSI